MSGKLKPRWYQIESSKALFESIKNDKNCHPVAVLPTGSGKTFTICELINLYLSHKPNAKVLVLSHVAEILEQNHKSIENYFDTEIGLYSSGLKIKEIKKITVAGIQSIYNKTELFYNFELIIIDECHRIPISSETMYRKFLNNIDANYVGLTATPHRLKHGYIYDGDGAIFNHLSYNLSSMAQYNRLVEDGFLSQMYGKGTYQKLIADDENVRTTAGDYNQKDLSMAFDRDAITESAINEVFEFGLKRKLWLIFAIDINHAQNIANKISKKGKSVVCVHSKMKENRKQIIKNIKNMEYEAIVNVDVLTTGFDVPEIDLIVDLSPTKSPAKHVQKLGRGARIHKDKKNCLVMDFAGNIARLGPINCVQIKTEKKTKTGGSAIMKQCPCCSLMTFSVVKICENCGYEYHFVEKIKNTADLFEPVIKDNKKWIDVTDIEYSIHSKRGRTSSLRVLYNAGLTGFSEWISFDHRGYAGHKARNWVKFRINGCKMPDNLAELYKITDILTKPKKIQVDFAEKYPKIIDYKFNLKK